MLDQKATPPGSTRSTATAAACLAAGIVPLGPAAVVAELRTIPPADVLQLPAGGGYLVVRRQHSSCRRNNSSTVPYAASLKEPAAHSAAAAGDAAYRRLPPGWSSAHEQRYQQQLARLRLALLLALRRRALRQWAAGGTGSKPGVPAGLPPIMAMAAAEHAVSTLPQRRPL